MKTISHLPKYIPASVLLAIVCACSTPSRLSHPKDSLPVSFKLAGALPDSASAGAKPWRMFYGDSCLTSLVAVAVENNANTKIALERIRVAQSTYAIMRSGLFPRIDAAVNARVDKFGDYTMNGVGNDDTNRSESLPPDQKLPDPYPEFFGGITFSWEANLWGKLSNRRKASLARFMASQEARHGVITQLVSALARHYYSLIGLDQEKKVLQQNLELQEMAFQLVQIQKAGGKVTQLGVDQFESQLLNTRSRLLRIDQQILATEALLNQLAGRYPQPLARWSINEYDSFTGVPAGTPQQLIYQRPDLREAEFSLIAAGADVSVARAAFYPGLSISAATGFSAFEISKWFVAPASAIYSIGGGLTAPVFQRGRIKALYAAANARQRIALAEYQKTLLEAYHEVYTVGHNHHNLQGQLDLKQREVEVQRRASVNSNDLFSVGYANYLEVITAQRRLLDVELELTNLKKDLLQNRAVLYRALGGGWSHSE